MLQGYPFYGAAGAATIIDPILRAAVTTVTIRGGKKTVKIMGISRCGDTPTFLNMIQVKVGNSEPGYRTVDVDPNDFDGDTFTDGAKLNYVDVGGFEVQEQETITITLVGTGNFSGVLWIEDGEPTISIPAGGRIVSLEIGGTVDLATATADTGMTMDDAKLENGNLYTPFAACVMAEDKLPEVLLIAVGKDVMTLPPCGKMVYPSAPIQFTGEQYNASQVIGYGKVQAATKVEMIIYCVETQTGNTTPSAAGLSVPSGQVPLEVLKNPIVLGISSGGRSTKNFRRR